MKFYLNKNNCPDELLEYYEFKNNKKIQKMAYDYKLFKKYFGDIKPSNDLFSFECEICFEKFNTTFKRTKRRKYFSERNICPKCILKLVTNTDEWRKTNSNAQLLAQNRPEVKRKMSESVKKSKTPDVLKKHSLSSKKMWKNEEYRKKQINSVKEAYKNMSETEKYKLSCKNRFYTGKYQSKFGLIYFNSSWELAFIIWCEKNIDIVGFKRCRDAIEYYDKSNKKRLYFPDFEIEDKNGDVFIVEIKGKYNGDNVLEKIKFAKLYYENEKSFLIYFRNDLIRMGIILQKHNAKEFCKKFSDKIIDLIEGNSNDKNKKQKNNTIQGQGI